MTFKYEFKKSIQIEIYRKYIIRKYDYLNLLINNKYTNKKKKF